MVHLATVDSPGHCIWLLGICAWLNMEGYKEATPVSYVFIHVPFEKLPVYGNDEHKQSKSSSDIPQMFAKIQQFFTLSFFLKIAFPIQAYFLEISHTFWSCTFNESF